MHPFGHAASGLRHVVEISLQALLVVAIAATLLLALSPIYQPADFLSGTANVEAGQGRYATSVWADPGTVQAGDHFDVVGCDYDTDLGNVIVTFTGGSWGSALDRDGCFRIEHIPALSGDTLEPGTYEISVRQKVGKRWRETGEAYIKVVP